LKEKFLMIENKAIINQYNSDNINSTYKKIRIKYDKEVIDSNNIN